MSSPAPVTPDSLVQHWVIRAHTIDGPMRFFIVGPRDLAEKFRRDLEQFKGEYATKSLAPWYLITNPNVPWREITEADCLSSIQASTFQNMDGKVRKAGPIESE